jgi:hypothetical protein
VYFRRSLHIFLRKYHLYFPGRWEIQARNQKEAGARLILDSFFFGFIFDPEDRDERFLRSVSGLPPKHTPQ